MKATNTEHTVINGNQSKCPMTQFNLGGALTKSGTGRKDAPFGSLQPSMRFLLDQYREQYQRLVLLILQGFKMKAKYF